MDRRDFTKLLAGMVTAASLPVSVQAGSPIGSRAEFLSALKEKPWLLGYLGTTETELTGNLRITDGQIPNGLRGNLFRNGAAIHNIGSDRFQHWFDAPGMIQRFSFSDFGVSHHGRMVATKRNLAETQAGRIEFTGFGTHAPRLTSGGSADAGNTANISLLDHAGELLALWEGGSAHVIDPETLETEGRKVWSDETNGLPFGAHPRVDRDGSLWNIGYSVEPNALILYHISAGGALQQVHVIPLAETPMIHDFMITATKIVIVAPPYSASNLDGDTFLDLFEWKGRQPTRVLVIDKGDLTNITEMELDPFFVFHFGNAYDISPTEIGFDFALYEDHSFMDT